MDNDHKAPRLAPAESLEVPSDPVPEALWWRDAVMYQVYLRSFADANGDGVGDLPGVRSRLGYISELGVDGIWLNPFYKSPQDDGGYDVADYFDIDPLFGTLSDFDDLLADAHSLGLRVLIDLVPNHTSADHEWFHAALDSPPGSKERGRYIFRPGKGSFGEDPPNNWRSVFGGSAWSRVADAGGSPGEWYLHLFAPAQPDLNWECEEVREYFDEVLRFWLDRGVDGFRIDVAHGMIKQADLPDLPGEDSQLQDGPAPGGTAPGGTAPGAPGAADSGGGASASDGDHPYWDRDPVHDIYRRWRRILDEYRGEQIFLAEAWVKTPARLARYLRPDELHMAFNFEFLTCDWDATGLKETIASTLANLGEVGATPTWVLSNHDVVRHVTRYGGGPMGVARARAGLLLMLALPGGTFLYQGEELGLPEVVDLPDDVLQDPTFFRTEGKVRGRDGCRVPIPWQDSGPSFGFSTVSPWLPQPASWAEISVGREMASDTSMLSLYRQAIRQRRGLKPLFERAELTWLDSSPGMLAFQRGDRFACVVNCADEAAPIPPTALSAGPVALSSYDLDFDPVGQLGALMIPGNAALWFSGPAS